VNLLHVVPVAAVEALFAGAADVLPDGGVLLLYGPFHDAPAEPRLARFDRELRAHQAALGIRPLAALLEVAADHGLELGERAPGREPGDLLLHFRRG
jgi:hypothetical protein